MADPGNMQTIEELRSMTGLEIKPAVGIPEEIRRAINIQLPRQLARSSAKSGWRCRSQTQKQEQPEKQDLDLQLSQAPIVRTADLLLAQAVRDRASDIHLEPEADCASRAPAH